MADDLNALTVKIQNFFDQNKLWIDEHNTSKLVVKQRLKPWSYAFLVVWAILFAGIPIGLVIFVASETGIKTLTCQRHEETTNFDCTWSTRKFLGWGPETERQVISQVIDAKLDSARWSNDNGGGTEKMWVTLMNQSGHLRIFETSYAIESGFEPTFQPETAAEIQRQLKSDGDTFAIVEDSRLGPQFLGVLLLASPFVLISICVAYVGLRSRTITLDKINHLYTRQINTLLGPRVKQYELDEIQSITVEKVRRHTDTARYYAYCLEIRLKSNRKYRFLDMRNYQTVSDVALQMQSFIKPA